MMSNRNLIIGGASNYTWDQLKHWVNSIKLSGFKGDIVIVGTNLLAETIQKLNSEGVQLALYGKQNENGDIKSDTNNLAPHVERFFYIYDFLERNSYTYDNVIATDVRDVIFQLDPTEWLEKNNAQFVASSEMMQYKDEPWNNQNLLEAFGPYFHNKFSSQNIYNVGVVAGKEQYVKDMMFMIFQMSINRPIPVVDQVVYNVLLNQYPYETTTMFTTNSHGWAVNLGTTEDAIRSGAGDIGMMIKQNPSKWNDYYQVYIGQQPELTDDGFVVNRLYTSIIVHIHGKIR